MEIKAIIFDMDGVLIDSESVCDRTWETAAKEKGISNSQDAINRCRGTNSKDTVFILKEIYGEDFDSTSFLARTSELFHKIEETDGIPLMPYVIESLKYLKSKYRLALASSTRQTSVNLLFLILKLLLVAIW